MSSTADIVPGLGFGALFLQTGPSEGYSAWDCRRQAHPFVAAEGILAAGAFRVSQRAAGSNMTVDVAANVAASNGASALVLGDSLSTQGYYTIAPSASVLNVDVPPADPTNPTNHLVILEVRDDAHDGSGSNLARVRVVTGTPNSSAALTDALGVNGTPALPASSLPLAVVNVPASDTSVSDSQIDDRRPRAALQLGPGAPVVTAGAGGKTMIATSEARTNTAYGLLTTPDQVSGVVVPDGALVYVGYQALWFSSVAGVGRAAIFIGSNQLKIHTRPGPSTPPQVQEASSTSTVFAPLATSEVGLACDTSNTFAALSDVTTGQVLSADEVSGGGLTVIQGLAAGTYTFSVQFKSSSGSVTVKERKLWAWVQAFA